jgi:hypothetical protein
VNCNRFESEQRRGYNDAFDGNTEINEVRNRQVLFDEHQFGQLTLGDIPVSCLKTAYNRSKKRQVGSFRTGKEFRTRSAALQEPQDVRSVKRNECRSRSVKSDYRVMYTPRQRPRTRASDIETDIATTCRELSNEEVSDNNKQHQPFEIEIKSSVVNRTRYYAPDDQNSFNFRYTDCNDER